VADDGAKNEGLLSVGGLRNILPTNLMSWKEEFFVLVTSKAFSALGEPVDEEMLTESEMPPWLDLDTLYMFKCEKEDDASEFRKKIAGREMLLIEPVQDSSFKGKYNFAIELKQKVYFVGVEFCKDLNRWLAALRKAKQTNEELSRMKGVGIRRNVDPLLGLYKKRNLEELVAVARGDFEKVVGKIGDQQRVQPQELVKAQKELISVLSGVDSADETLDSIQAVRPFYPELLRVYLKEFHLQFTNTCKHFWNNRMREFDVRRADQAASILEFLNCMFLQEKLANEYGLTDPRYKNSYNELTATFCVRTYRNMVPLVMEVLEKMKSEIYLEKAVCLSHGPVDLFKFLSQVVEMYRYCPQKDVIHHMLSLCFK